MWMSVFVVLPALPALIDWHIQPRHFCSSECQGWGLHWQCSWCSGHVPAVWRGSGRQISCVCPHDVASQLSLFTVHLLHACVCILPTLSDCVLGERCHHHQPMPNSTILTTQLYCTIPPHLSVPSPPLTPHSTITSITTTLPFHPYTLCYHHHHHLTLPFLFLYTHTCRTLRPDKMNR